MAEERAGPLFAGRGLEKAYTATAPVLRGVDLEIQRGEVHALVGANGAGKTTLARIVCGLHRPDRGKMELDGERYAPASKLEAEASFVQIVQQELNLIGTLTVSENLAFGRFPRRRGLIDRLALATSAREALTRVGLEALDPDVKACDLGIGIQQLVEIARALARRAKLLVLDEPTAALTDPQVENLFANIRRLTASGTSVLYISHRLEELARIADRATILRDGKVVASERMARLDRRTIVRHMAGSEIEELAPRRGREEEVREAALRVEGLRVSESSEPVSFVVHRGEILGVSGLVGAGRTRLLRTVFGARRAHAGGVALGPDGPLERFESPVTATRAGLAMIPEDRKRDGLLLPRSVRLNVALASISGRVSLSPAAERELAQKGAEPLDIQRRNLDQPVSELSGGNQQKVIVARWLLRDQSVLLFDEPTRGIDVAARASLYGLIQELADAGKAIVVASSDLDELLTLCDRIAVMARGRLVTILDRGDFSREALTAAAVP